MRFIGKTTYEHIEGFERLDRFPDWGVDYRSILVTTYWFLFIPVYRTTERV